VGLVGGVGLVGDVKFVGVSFFPSPSSPFPPTVSGVKLVVLEVTI
jgi:hypothetical protein